MRIRGLLHFAILPGNKKLDLLQKQDDHILSMRKRDKSGQIPLLHLRCGNQPLTPEYNEVNRETRYFFGSSDEGQQDQPFIYDESTSRSDPSFDGSWIDREVPFQETVQERVDNWKHWQTEQSSSLIDSPRDEQGRLKLLTSVSKGSRALVFFLLMWRDIHLFEVADRIAQKKPLTRLFLAVPLVFLFVANMTGMVASLATPSHAAKKRLKAILNLDKLLEIGLMAFNLIRLTVLPSRYTPREVYIANLFHSVFFFFQCQTFTKLSWDENSARPVNSYNNIDSQGGAGDVSEGDHGWSAESRSLWPAREMETTNKLYESRPTN